MVEQFLRENKQLVDRQLPLYVEHLDAPEIIKQAMIYSLKAGGKRIRPLLLLATLKAFGKEVELGLPVACAIEMIHTYSLIHDDLPSMDNDDLRRGKPTNHKVFGEAMAILAGDGLLTYSFQVIAEMDHQDVTPEIKIKLISELAKAAGPEGMVAGQVADMQGEGKQLSLDELEYIHQNKTGRMLQYSIIAGAILAGASEQQIRQLSQFAYHLGLAFQIRDDILDIEGTEEKIGKPVGSDIENKKVTYPSLLTLDGAKEKLAYHIEEAKRYLRETQIADDVLHYICDLIATRDH
ncbi:geranylgeranyl diphosphate synthase type II [Anoxybacillus vitaminiphilus]|uniref:Farnesyl diphosphate synthase n=1 Tax=Paranoxybacillus vitaminiphilus TaxID=581036 RepID=A0A327YPX3_9BACL|nr:farnesyl diphosphate synthase [Anoxybacillus vitaminiphilus]RAK22326.1 geranylgeranyl diphosphate synthase type II [Anoxybacillus vitaminiphilus]